MNVCKKCGTRFEGKFCPECGEAVVAICPVCGQEVAGKFCSNCGHNMSADEVEKAVQAQTQPNAQEAEIEEIVEEEPAKTAADENAPQAGGTAAKGGKGNGAPEFVKKLYAFMPHIVPIIFAAFIVLMLICYAGGVSKSELGEAFGDKPANVYSSVSAAAEDVDFSFDEGGSSVQGTCGALIAFGVIGLLLAAAGLAVSFWVPLRATKFKIGDRELRLTSILDVASCVIMFVIFLLGCILCGSAGDELGLSKPGAAPVCIIVFSIFFALFMAAAMFGRKIISFFFKDVKCEYDEAREAERAQVVPPLSPVPVDKPVKEKKPKKPYKYVVPDEVNNSVTEEEKKKIVRHIKRREVMAYIALSPFTLAFGSIFAIIHFLCTKTRDFWKVYKRASLRAAIVLSIVAICMLIAFEITMVGLPKITRTKPIYSWNALEIEIASAADRNNLDADGKIQNCTLGNSDLHELGIIEYHKLSNMTNEEFAQWIFIDQNLRDMWASSRSFEGLLRENYDNSGQTTIIICCIVADCLKYCFATGDGYDNAVNGFKQGAAPLLEAIDTLNQTFELDLSNYEDFSAICNGALGDMEVEAQGDAYKLTVSYSKYDSTDSTTKYVTADEYASLQTVLDSAEMTELKRVRNSLIDEDNNYFYDSFYFSTLDYCAGMYNNIAYNLYVNGGDAYKAVNEFFVNYENVNMRKVYIDALNEFAIAHVPFYAAALVYLIVMIWCAVLLPKSTKYTVEVYGTKRVKNVVEKISKKEYKKIMRDYKVESEQIVADSKRHYNEQRKLYNEYLKDRFNWWVEKGYFEEGIVRKV